MTFSEGAKDARIDDLEHMRKDLETRLDAREDLLQDIYQMWWPFWIKSGLNEDHPLLQAVMDRIQEIPNEHDGKTLQEVMNISDDLRNER